MKIIVKRLITEGKESDAQSIYEELIALTKVEEGCIEYRLFRDENNQRLFVLMEEWENDHFLEKHMQTEHFKMLVPKLDNLTEIKHPIEKYKVMG
jgi:quinol monooxygenase YgiN